MVDSRVYWWLVVLLLVDVSVGQAKPRHWYTDKKWWAGEAIIALSTSLDAQSTCRGFGRGAVENNFALSGNTSCRVTAGVMAGGFGFYTTLHIMEWDVGHNDKNRVIRSLTPWMVPAAVAGVHLSAAIHNYRLKLPEPAK